VTRHSTAPAAPGAVRSAHRLTTLCGKITPCRNQIATLILQRNFQRKTCARRIVAKMMNAMREKFDGIIVMIVLHLSESETPSSTCHNPDRTLQDEWCSVS
jgi:hypothetical protein